MEKDTEKAEGDPEEKVLVVESEGEDDAEDRAAFAQGGTQNEAGLYACGVVVRDRAGEILIAKDEREYHKENRHDGESDDDQRVFAEQRA
ncbi:MAG: hypothetical protein LC730_07010, partial [Acidobacteria bacterium]|nr:hypothetical protein [Acidobacteriota bacterium]